MIRPKNIADALFILSEKGDDPKSDESDRASEKKIAKGFLEFAKSKNILYQVPEVLRHLRIKSEKQRESETLNIVVSHDVSDKIISEIEKAMDIKDKEKKVSIDDKIIGGFIAEHKGKILDASIASQLTKLKARIANIN